MTDRLRPLWDFDDLNATEARFRDQLARESTDEGRAEVFTQLARIEGLRGDFEKGDRLIEEAEARAGHHGVARARIDLERGRLRRSSGQASLRFFESAVTVALDACEYFIGVDAAHMAALAAPDDDAFVAWTKRGIELGETHETASYWLGPLLNNLGWKYFETSERESALDAFERALRSRERDSDNAEAIALAKYAVAKTLRSLGRPDEAVTLLEEAVGWAESVGAPDGWFHEELAEAYGALGRESDAREQAKLALALPADADPALEPDDERAARLRDLAGTSEEER